MALDEEKQRQIEQRREAAARAREKMAEVKAQSAQTATTPAISASAAKAGASDTSMTAGKVNASIAEYEKNSAGSNDMKKVVQNYGKQSVVYSDMSYDDALSFATKIVYDDERDAFLTKWRKAAGTKGNAAYMEDVPTMDELRKQLNSQTAHGLYQSAKESYSEGVQESFKNDVTANKAFKVFDGLTDANGNAINMNTASISDVVRAIRTTASESRRKQYVEALSTLTKTKGNRFYGLEFDSTTAKTFIDSAALTEENYKKKTANYSKLFSVLEGSEDDNAQAYAQAAQRIEESGESDYVKRQLRDALNDAWEEQTGTGVQAAQEAWEAAKTAQQTQETQETQQETGGLFSWLFQRKSSGEPSPGESVAQEQRPTQTTPKPQETPSAETTPAPKTTAKQEEATVEGETHDTVQRVPSFADALADEEFAQAYAKEQAKKYGEIDLTGDPIRAAAYISTGNANQLTRETQDAFNALIKTSAAARAVMGYSYHDAAAIAEEGAENEDPFAIAKANAARFDALGGDTTFILGSTLAYYLNMARSDSFPQSLRDDMEGAIMEIGVAAEQAYENGEIEYDRQSGNLYDAYIKANPSALEQVRGVVRTVSELEKEAKRQIELSAQEEEKSEQERLAEHRAAVDSGVYTQAAYEHVLESAPEVTTRSAKKDETYKALSGAIYDEWMDDAQDGWYTTATSAYLQKNGLAQDMDTAEASCYKALLESCMEDVLLSDMRVAATLGYDSLDALYSKWGGMDLDKLHARAEAAVRSLEAQTSEEDIETLDAINAYTGTGEGIGVGTVVAKGAEYGVTSAAGSMLEGIWALSTISKEEAPLAVQKVREKYTQEYSYALAATMYRHDMYECAENAPSAEQGEAIKAYLDAGYDPFEIGIDPGDALTGGIMSTAKAANDRANALASWAQENLNKAKGTIFEASGATTNTLTLTAVSTIGSAVTGSTFAGMYLGYGMSGLAEQTREQLSEGRDRKGSLVMGSVYGASVVLANMGSFGRINEKLSGLVGLSSLSAIGAQNVGDMGATRTVLGMVKAFGKSFLHGAGETLADEVIGDEIKEALTWQTLGGAADAALGGANVLGAICAGLGNIDVTEIASDVLGNAWQNTLCTLPLAVLGGLGEGFTAARVAARELAATGSADAAKKTVKAIGAALSDEENRAALKQAAHDAQVGAEIVYQAMTDEEIGAQLDTARKADEQQAAHAQSQRNSEQAAQTGRESAVSAQERMNAGEVNPELVTQIANGVKAAAQQTQSAMEHRREKEQKQQEAQEAYAQAMRKAEKAAQTQVKAQEAQAQETTFVKRRVAELEEEIRLFMEAANRALEADEEPIGFDYFAETLEELYSEKAELEARMESEEFAREEQREMAQMEADEMAAVYKTLRETKLYVDDTQRANILARSGMKTLGQVNRKYGLRLTNDKTARVPALDAIMPELAELAPGYIAREIDVSEDALLNIVERKKELKGMQASVGETAYEKYLPDGAFYNIQDPAMQQVTSAVAKTTGVQIVVAPLTNNVRAIYDRENNRIILSNRIGAGKAMRKAVMHELTHYIEGGKGYEAYKDAVLKAAYLTDEDGSARRADEEKIRSTYAKANIKLTDEGLQKELVAAATEAIIEDTDGRLVNRLLRQTKGNNALTRIVYRALGAITHKIGAFIARQYAKKEGRLEAYEAIEEAYDRLTNALIDGGTQTGDADVTIDLDTQQRLWGDTANVGEDGQMQFALAPNQFGNETAQKLRTIDDEVKKILAGSEHEVVTERQRLDAAWDAINTRGREAVTDELMSKASGTWDAQDNVNAALLGVLANRDGNITTAIAIFARYNDEGTSQAQALQARNLINKLTPEGAIMSMVKTADDANAKKGVPKDAFPRGEDAPKGDGEGVPKAVKKTHEKAKTLTQELAALPGDVSDNNPWKLPLTDWKMALIDQYKLRNTDLPGAMYNRATKKERMLSAIIASDEHLDDAGREALCQQLEAIQKGYAVVTVADARYAASMAAEFRMVEGTDAVIPVTQEGKEALGRMLDAQGNVVQANLYQKWTSLRFTNMLSSPATWTRNIAANVVEFAVERPAEAIATVADNVYAKKTGTRTIDTATRAERQAGNKAFRKEVVQTARDYFITHVDTSHGRKYDVNGRGRTFDNAVLDAYCNIVDFAMQMGDRPFYEKKYAEQSEILKRIGMKVREEQNGKFALRDMTAEEIHQEATMRALYSVLQEDNAVVEALNGLRKDRNMDIALTALMPFIQAPSNGTLRALAYSPAGLGKAIGQNILLAQHIDKGTWTPQEQYNAELALGQGLTGTGLYVGGMALMAAGILRLGREDEDNANRSSMLKSQGVPYGTYLQIGDTMHEISWMTPIGGTLAAGAKFYAMIDDGEGYGSAMLESILSGVGDTMMDMPMLSSVNEIFRGYDSSANIVLRVGGTAAKSLVTQTFSPGILRAIAKATDPYVRDTSSRSDILSALTSGVIANYPLLRQMLPKATDVTGDDMLQSGYYSWGKDTQNAVMHFLDSFFTPTATIGEKNDDALFELVDLSYRAGETAFLPKALISDNGKMTVTKTMAQDMGTGDAGYTLMLTDDERREANRLYGSLIFNGLSGAQYAAPYGGTYDQSDLPGIRNMMESGEWDEMTDAEKIDAVEDMKKTARELVTYRAVKGEL